MVGLNDEEIRVALGLVLARGGAAIGLEKLEGIEHGGFVGAIDLEPELLGLTGAGMDRMVVVGRHRCGGGEGGQGDVEGKLHCRRTSECVKMEEMVRSEPGTTMLPGLWICARIMIQDGWPCVAGPVSEQLTVTAALSILTSCGAKMFY